MMKTKILLFIAVAMLPMVVISFSYKTDETNFNLALNGDNRKYSNVSYHDYEECEDMEAYSPFDDEIIRVKSGGTVKNIPLEQYAVGVVAGEMPASFNIEALKAQAVGRTYALYRKSTSGNSSYDVTDDTRTQVYIDEAAMRKKWGRDYDKYHNKILQAVNETRGEVITYDGKIIEAFYCAMSGGTTQDASTVFNVSRDYLKAVESTYDNTSINGYQVTREYEQANVIKLFGLSCNTIIVDYINYNKEGYVENLSLCNKKLNGKTFSNKMGLRSANFSIELANKMKITTRGFGHGVGMSQYGAHGYAEAGYTYDEILKHYYTGVEITNLKNV